MSITPDSPAPFRFCRNIFLAECSGTVVHSLVELINALKIMPDAALYYHTFCFMHRFPGLFPSVTNEFSYWVSQVMREEKLGDELSAVDFNQCATLAYLREHYVRVLSVYVMQNRNNCFAVEDNEALPIMLVRSSVMSVSVSASTLGDMAAYVRNADSSVFLFHVYEARLRLPRGSNDFSVWIKQSYGKSDLADTIASLSLNIQTFDMLKDRICSLIETETCVRNNYVNT